MSARARRFDRAEPNKKRPKRKRPRGQLIATITTFTQPRDATDDDKRRTYYIRRRRIRTRVRPDDEPGKDGFRWTCSCVEITRAYLNTAAGRKLFADGRTDCEHMTRVLDGKDIVEGTAPDVCMQAARKMEIEWITYVEFTRLGDELLRWRWAMHALKDTSDK